MHLPACPLCGGALSRWFTACDTNVDRCPACGLAMLNPQPDDATLDRIYGATYFIGSTTPEMHREVNALKRATAGLQLDEIAAHSGGTGGRLLEVGCGLGNFLLEARARGYRVNGIDVSESAVTAANRALGEPLARAGRLEDMGLAAASFDVVALADVIEHVRDPRAFLAVVHDLVRPGGLVFLTVPSLDSLSARLMGRWWVEFKHEHLYYFDRATISRLLRESGFGDIAVTPGHKVLTLTYVVGHFEKFPVPALTPLMRLLKAALPARLLTRQFQMVASGINVVARRPA